MSELLDTGYEPTTYAARRLRVVTALRGAHPTLAKVDFGADTPEGQIVNQVCEDLSDLDETVQACWDRLDPANASAASALSIARLRGTAPRAATYSTCTCAVVVSGGPYAVGALVAFVEDEPDNLWANTEIVSASGDIEFQAQLPGSQYVALAGTLTQKVAVSGWTSIINAADSVSGRDEDSPELTLYRSEALRYFSATNGLAAMRAAVLAVEGVVDAIVVDAAGSVAVLIWDGVTEDADDDLVAAAISSRLPPGIVTTGTIENTATGRLIKFDRATVTNLYVDVVDLEGAGVDPLAVKAACQSVLPNVLGGTVRWAVMLSEILKVAGVTDVDDLLLDDVDPPVQSGDNFTAGADEWFVLDSGDINVDL